MIYQEYGKQNSDVIILLHGGGLSWWNYREAAEILQKDFHVILPILDGHGGSDKDFTTIRQNAEEIIAFIDEYFGGQVLLMGGLSLGGQILLEILSQRGDICKYALLESPLVIPSQLTYALIKPAFGSCHGLIRRKWFSKLQFQYLRMPPHLFDDYYRDTCRITKANMIAFLQENAIYRLKESLGNCAATVRIYVGGRESRVMQLSAKKIHSRLSGSSLQVLPKLHHGEFSMNHAGTYADAVYTLVKP